MLFGWPADVVWAEEQESACAYASQTLRRLAQGGAAGLALASLAYVVYQA